MVDMPENPTKLNQKIIEVYSFEYVRGMQLI